MRCLYNVSWTSVRRTECYLTSLVMSTHVVTQPNDGNWLSNVATTSDEIQGEIAGPHRDMLHIQQYCISSCSNAATNDNGSESVLKAVCHDCSYEGKDSGDDEDWDAHHLSMN